MEAEPDRRGPEPFPVPCPLGGPEQTLEGDHPIPEMPVAFHDYSSPRRRSQPPTSRPISSMDLVAKPSLLVWRHCRSLASRIGNRRTSSVEMTCSSRRWRPLVRGLDQPLQQAVEVAFDAIAQDVAVIAGEATRVIAGPEDQVVSLRDHYQFLLFFHGHAETMMLYFYEISRAFRMPLRLAAEREPDLMARNPSAPHGRSLADCQNGSRIAHFGSVPASPGKPVRRNYHVFMSLLKNRRSVVVKE